MAKTLIAQHGEKRRGLERGDHPEFFIWLQFCNRTHDLGKRLASIAQVFPDIQRDNFLIHGLAEAGSVFESVSSIENCFVALTACRRFGGM